MSLQAEIKNKRAENTIKLLHNLKQFIHSSVIL